MSKLHKGVDTQLNTVDFLKINSDKMLRYDLIFSIKKELLKIFMMCDNAKHVSSNTDCIFFLRVSVTEISNSPS